MDNKQRCALAGVLFLCEVENDNIIKKTAGKAGRHGPIKPVPDRHGLRRAKERIRVQERR